MNDHPNWVMRRFFRDLEIQSDTGVTLVFRPSMAGWGQLLSGRAAREVPGEEIRTGTDETVVSFDDGTVAFVFTKNRWDLSFAWGSNSAVGTLEPERFAYWLITDQPVSITPDPALSGDGVDTEGELR